MFGVAKGQSPIVNEMYLCGLSVRVLVGVEVVVAKLGFVEGRAHAWASGLASSWMNWAKFS